ncbi:MAG: lipopolysaccharide heptosyltransferase II [Methylococcales bacterium]|nr:lipopolysaccharide heptosyltransferase II [Methylococcales bacterium]
MLVIGPSWVGDMVMAQSLFISLKRRNPNCRIDVVAPAWSFALLERMPEVRQAIAMPLGHGHFGLTTRLRLGRQLRSNRYTQAIVLPNSWKSALPAFFAGIPLRSGYVGEARYGLLNDARRLNRERLGMTVQRFAALAWPPDASLPPACPYPRLSISRNSQDAACEKFGLSRNGNILALCPGAEYGPAKRWPAGHYAQVARKMHDLGWQVWLFGSGKDQLAASETNALSGGVCHDFTGRTSLGEAVDLLSLTSIVVSNDSGLMHVAAALDKRLIALYGSSDPAFTPPLHDAAIIIDLNLPCSPCFKRECPLSHTRCLHDISPAMVLAAINA